MSQPTDQTIRAAQDIKLDSTVSDMCGVTMNDSVEGRIVIDGHGKLEFDMAEISEALGRQMDPYTFQVEMSTHYGRMVLFEDRIVLFGKLEDALEYE